MKFQKEDQDCIEIKRYLNDNSSHIPSRVNHMAIKKTYRIMRRAYFWPGMYLDVKKFINECDRCCKSKKALHNCYTEGTNVFPASIVYGHELEIPNLDEYDTSLYWLRDRENENRRVKKNFDKTVPNGMTYWKNNYRINDKKVKKLDDPYVPRNINWIDEEKDNNPCYDRKQKNNITLLKYCICKMSENDTDFMIECSECLNWFHGKCIKIKKRHLVNKNYYCPEYKIKKEKNNYVDTYILDNLNTSEMAESRIRNKRN
ncbi:hypothetical protein A3Q56_01907 [Intoshia linei]|uniref:Zinc finger PHD-type domain-containing protein n=1 Tax=Intoshia linei TaxID=1819745 RepID=A0A177B880_9BILA|nr:hypothetical protein A3Q56_01907 [Intoshia linei]